MKTLRKIKYGVNATGVVQAAFASGDLFSTPGRSDFGDFLNQSLCFWRRPPPGIQAAINADLDARALADKRLRQQDKPFRLAQSVALFTEPLAGPVEAGGGFLAPGRPRPPAVVVAGQRTPASSNASSSAPTG